MPMTAIKDVIRLGKVTILKLLQKMPILVVIRARVLTIERSLMVNPGYP